MSATSQYPRLGEWLQRWLRLEPHQVIGGPDDPYLLRWYVIPRNPWLNVYVHKFCRSDDDRALHDHPWWFVSLMLSGRYDEITEAGTKRRRTGSIAYRPAAWRHRVALLWESCTSCGGSGIGYGTVPGGRWMETDCGVCDGSGTGRYRPCWTLIVTGRRSRTWGFWCERWDLSQQVGQLKKRFVPWQEWDDATGCGEVS